MSPSAPTVYDFAAAANVERPLARAIRVWTDKFAEMFLDRWSEFATTELKVQPLPVNAYPFEQAQSGWDRSLAGTLQIRDDLMTGLLVGTRDHLLGVVSEILGQPKPEDVDRELTAVERSLCQLFFEQIVATLGEAWPEQEVLPTRFGELVSQPHRSRLFPPDQSMLMVGIQLQIETGPADVYLVVPKHEAMILFGIDHSATQPAPSNDTIRREQVEQIAVELTVQIGETELELGEFVDLASGDVVVFDQKIDQPLVVMVNQLPRFLAWPGRAGNRQVLKIDSLL